MIEIVICFFNYNNYRAQNTTRRQSQFLMWYSSDQVLLSLLLAEEVWLSLISLTLYPLARRTVVVVILKVTFKAVFIVVMWKRALSYPNWPSSSAITPFWMMNPFIYGSNLRQGMLIIPSVSPSSLISKKWFLHFQPNAAKHVIEAIKKTYCWCVQTVRIYHSCFEGKYFISSANSFN